MWGSSFFLIKKGLLAFKPLEVASLRISIAGIAFLPFFIYNFKKIDWSKIKHLLVVGAAGSAIPSFLFAIGQTEVSSSIAGVLNSTTPLFVLILGTLFFGLTLTKEKVWGVVLGLAGATILIFLKPSSESDQESGNQWYALFLILATMCYAYSGNTVQKYFQKISPVNLSAAAYCLVAPLGIIYLLFSDFSITMQTHPDAMTSFWAVTILSLASTVVASVIFFKLVQITSAVFASMVAYLIPIVALGLGVFDGETVSSYHFLGMALILLGVYITKKNEG